MGTMRFETSQRLQLARDLQRSLSPEVLPQVEGYDLAVYYQPADLVGGDSYDVMSNGHVSLLIADAAGHGLSAAVYIARAKAYLHSELMRGKRPSEVLVEVNRRLLGEGRSRLFVTAFCAQLDASKRRLWYASAGHFPPFVVRDHQVQVLEEGGKPLGVSEEFVVRDRSVELEEGDVLVLYTDGVIQAWNAREEVFTEERLVEVVRGHVDTSAQTMVDRIVDAVSEFCGGVRQEDDFTLLVLKVGRTDAGKVLERVPAVVGGIRRPIVFVFIRLLGAVGVVGESMVEVLDEIAMEYEGIWELLSEDGGLLVFGVPRVHEEDAARAVEAMEHLRSRVRGMSGVRVRAGVHVGQGILRPDGTVVYSLIGDTLNRAFALEQWAASGQILLSEEIRQLASAYLDLSGVVAGVAGEPGVYALGEGACVRIEHQERARWAQATPCVGREAELERMHRCWEVCVEGKKRSPYLLGIRGEAGVGKTRVLREFVDRMQGHAPRRGFLEGHARAYGDPPYALFGTLLKAYLDIRGDDTERRTALEGGLDELWSHLPSEEQAGLQEVRPILGYLVGVPYDDPRVWDLDAEGLQKEVQGALGDFLRAVMGCMGTAPVILLEDLHWADAPSVGVLAGLVEEIESATPPLILATYREYYGGESGGEEMVLHALDEEVCHGLVRSLEGGEVLSDAMRRVCVERSGGNPLYLEELVQSAMDRKSEDKGRDRASAGGVRTEESVPETLMGLLLAQMDRLDGTAQQVARVGAVIGHEFEERILVRVAKAMDLDAEDVRGGLGALSRAVVVLPQAGGIWRFKHALIQDAAYETVLPGDRQVLHGLVATTIEEMLSEAPDPYVYAHALVHHYTRAGRPVDAHCWAGDAAFRVYAYAEARVHYAQALEALAQVSDTEESRRRRVDVLIKHVACSWRVDIAQILPRMVEAERLAKELPGPDGTPGGDRLRLARIHYWMGRVHYISDRLPEAIRHFEQVLEAAHELDDPELVATASLTIGAAMVIQGHLDKAKALLSPAIPALEQSGNWPEWIRAVGYYGMARSMSGECAAGIAEVQRAVARAEEIGALGEIATGTTLLSTAYLFGGDLPRAIEAGSRSAEASEQSDVRIYVCLGNALRAWAECRAGQFEAAGASMARAQAVLQEFGGRLIACDWIPPICAEIVLGLGRAEEALTLAERAIGVAQEMGGIFAEGMARCVRGGALATLEPSCWEEAETQFAESVRLLESGQQRVEAAHTRVAWGHVCRDRGDTAAARAHWERAAAQWEASDLTHELDRTRALIADLGSSW